MRKGTSVELTNITDDVEDVIFKADRKTEPTISKMEQVEEPMKTTDYCDICKRDMCEICVTDATNPYCVPSHYEINYEPKDEPQKIMEKCYKCRWWNYSYGCSNKKGICEFEPLKDEQSGKERVDEYEDTLPMQ